MKYPDLPSAMWPVTHNEKLPVPKLPENLTFSVDVPDSDEDRGSVKGNMLTAIQYLEQFVSHPPRMY
jgi:hypothetical protein